MPPIASQRTSRPTALSKIVCRVLSEARGEAPAAVARVGVGGDERKL